MSALIRPVATGTGSAWPRALVTLFSLWLLLGLLYADTVSGMVWIWIRSETFTHAFLVLPISLWLTWRRRDDLSLIDPQPQPWLLLAVLPLAALWLAGELVVVNAAVQFAWVAMLVVCVPGVLGVRVAYELLFPLLFLFFAVPTGEFMTHPMMLWTADFTVAALQFSGVPVYREGLTFLIPSGNWSVVEACSGVRYLIASFMVGTLFAYLNYRSWKRRAVFILLSIFVPIVANWVRAYGIVMLGHLSSNTLAVGVDHLIYGWIFFGIVIGIMFMIGARWSEPDSVLAPDSKADVVRHAVAAPAALMVGTALAALAVMLAPRLVLMGIEQTEKGSGVPTVRLPASLGPLWVAAPEGEATVGRAVSFETYKPQFQEPSAEAHGIYVGNRGRVGVYVAFYRNQDNERKLVSSMNVLAKSGGDGWNPMEAVGAKVEAAGQSTGWQGARLQAKMHVAAAGAIPMTVWRSYWIDGHWVAGDAEAKLRSSWARLKGHGDDGAAVVLWAEGAAPGQADALLTSFVRDNVAALDKLLQGVEQAH